MKTLRIAAIIVLAAALALAAAGISVIPSGPSGTPEERSTDYYMTQAQNYSKNGDYDLALACYRKVLQEEPEHVEALRGKLRSDTALNHKAEIMEDYDTLLRLVPDDVPLQLERLQAVISRGDREQAKAELEALMQTYDAPELKDFYSNMQVAAPEIDLPSGVYSEYMTLHGTSANKNSLIYYTANGSDPTADSPLLGDHLILTNPHCQYKFKAINFLGYESETVTMDYEITVPVEEVLRHDYSSTAYAVRHALNKDWDDPIYNYELAQMTELYIVGEAYWSTNSYTFYSDYFQPQNYTNKQRDRGDFNGSLFRYMPNLETIAICWQDRVALDEISQLPSLKNLSLLNNRIENISALAGMTGLEKLALGWNNISDISPLAGLQNLKSLGLWNNHITDISPLSALTGLEYLDIANNRVEDISAVSGMTSLKEFWANSNAIRSVAPLDPGKTLQTLMIAGNPLEDYVSWKSEHPGIRTTDITE